MDMVTGQPQITFYLSFICLNTMPKNTFLSSICKNFFRLNSLLVVETQRLMRISYFTKFVKLSKYNSTN